FDLIITGLLQKNTKNPNKGLFYKCPLFGLQFKKQGIWLFISSARLFGSILLCNQQANPICFKTFSAASG
ncbi:hypothetical protein, partial [Bacillus sp. OV322]|uniref:hypothetical protein n=1 Tax=Bacillus sp. OV322 TaxID=1882764 RepID=UPI001C4336D7